MPWQQPKLFRESYRTTRRRECSVTIGPKLVTDAAIMQCVAEAIGMVEHFGKGDRLREVLPCRSPIPRQLKSVPAHRMRADARIVAAEFVAKVTMASDVVHLESVAAAVERVPDVAPEKCRRPAAMVRLKQKLAITGALRDRHELTGALAGECGLASEIGVKPQPPFGLECSGTVPELLTDLARPGVGILHRCNVEAMCDERRRSELEQEIQLSAHPILRWQRFGQLETS